jgi:hypothetical protein
MSKIMEQVAVAAGKTDEVAGFLESVLGPGDQAWLVCSFTDCSHMVKGHCDVYTIINPPEVIRGKPCRRYEKTA